MILSNELILNNLPKGWKKVVLGENSTIRGRIGWKGLKQSEYVEDGPYLIAGKHIKNGKINWGKCDKITEKRYEESVEIALENGDIIFSKDGSLGNPAIIENLQSKATINSTMMLIRMNKNFDSHFVFQILNSVLFSNLIKERKSGSSIPHIFQRDMQSFSLPLPPLNEQQKIAEILITVDEKIDIIDQQIILTQELKKGLIQRLLTKGIGHTMFKDSPFGKIPQNWAVAKFGDLISSHCYGPRFSSKDYSETGNVKTIRGTDINKTGDILYKQVPTALLPNGFVENHRLKDGDLVMITTADCGLTGVYFDQGFPFIPSAYAVRITLNEKACPLYFKFIFQTELAKNQVEKFIRKGTVANLPGSDILKFIFPTPSFEEQKQIADILSTVDDKLEVLCEKKTYYQELKLGLMQQLLTGKIRVNGIFN